jgi:hypothetical protein
MRKSLAVAIVLFAAVAPGLASGAGRSWSVRFNFVPQRAFQGQPAAISVLVKPANARCTLAVRYVDGTIQDGLGTTHAVAGRAGWKWSLSQNAPAGLAKASVQCGRSGNLSRTFTVVGGSISHVSLSVVTSGYSQRPDRYGAGKQEMTEDLHERVLRAVTEQLVLDRPCARPVRNDLGARRMSACRRRARICTTTAGPM